MKKAVFIVLTLFVVFNLSADDTYQKVKEPIEGRWKTIDDKTGRPRSIVLLWVDSKGNLFGKVEELIRRPDEDQNPVCDKCSGEKKDKPVKGMEIVFGFTPDTKQDDRTWEGGKILDPKNGKVYGCNFSLSETLDVLHVRGYIGFSLLGRSQTWYRVKDSAYARN